MMSAHAISTAPAPAAAAAPAASPAARISQLLDLIHAEASTAKSSTDSAIVLEAAASASSPSLYSGGADDAPPSSSSSSSDDAVLVQSPAPAAASTDARLLNALFDITRILKPVADGLRSPQEDRMRLSLGESPSLPKASVELLHLTVTLKQQRSNNSSGSGSAQDKAIDAALQEAQLHLLRFFANLCIDSPPNRAVLCGVHAPAAVIALLADVLTLPAAALRGSAAVTPDQPRKSTAHYPASQLPLIRTAVGALLNMQLAHEPTRAALRADSRAIPVLAHITYSPAIYPLNAVSALLAPHSPAQASGSTLAEPSSARPEQNAGELGLELAGLRSESLDGDEALNELQFRASIAGWASQVLLDVCSDRPSAAGASTEAESTDDAATPGVDIQVNGATTGQAAASTSAGVEPDEDEDDEDDGEPEGEINGDVVASSMPLTALMLPLAAFLPSAHASSSSPSTPHAEPAYNTPLARALAEDEEARLSLVSIDIELLQNAVQYLEKAVLDTAAPEPVTPNPATELGEEVVVDQAGAVRRRMLERAELVRAPWEASPEAPALTRWLAQLARHLTASSYGSASSGGDGSDASTPTGVTSAAAVEEPQPVAAGASGRVSSECVLALLMHFLQRGHAPLLAAAAQRSASSIASGSLTDAAAAAALAASVPDPLTAGASAGALLRAAASSFGRCKSGLARVLVEVVGDDACMEVLFDVGADAKGTAGSGWFVDTLKRWMKADGVGVVGPGVAGVASALPRDDDMQSTALLAMGNLARKDSHCIALVHQHSLAPFLVSLLPASSTDTSGALPTAVTASRRLSHGVLSLLKNLSIPAQNKQPIGALGVISRVADAGFLSAAKENIQQVQFAAVGLLKHLCRGESGAAVEVILGRSGQEGGSGKPPLDALLALIAQTEDVPVRMEGTRVLVYVVKSLWSSTSSTQESAAEDIKRAKAVLVTKAGPAEAVRHALARMVRTAGKYPVLVNEGVVALTLLASENAESAEGVADALIYDSGSQGSAGTSAKTSTEPESPSILGGGAASAPVIMAEPESFDPASSAASAGSSTGVARQPAGTLDASSTPALTISASTSNASLRAGPVASLLRTETANLQPAGGSTSTGAAHEPPRRQSTAEAYVQAGLGGPSSSALPSTQHARSPLASSPAMDIDSPTTPVDAAALTQAAQAQQTPQAPPQSLTPARRGSAQMTASSLLTAPRPSALAMLDVVLGRRDARMPPLFASNAAVLVQIVASATLPASSSAGGGVVVKGGSAFEVARRTEEALERLGREGPEEAQGAARQALGMVRRRLGQA